MSTQFAPWKHYFRLWLLLGLLLGPGTPWAAGSAEETVAELHQALLGLMREGEQLKFSGRRERITPVIDRSFDFDTIARVAMGRYWRKMTPAQQDRSRQLIRRLTLGSYADNFSSWDGESFRFISRKEGRRGQRIVRAEMLPANGTPVQFDYVLKRGGDEQWRIINVLANGVSDLSLKRAEYGSIIRKKGIVELLQQIDAQIKRLYPES